VIELRLGAAQDHSDIIKIHQISLIEDDIKRSPEISNTLKYLAFYFIFSNMSKASRYKVNPLKRCRCTQQKNNCMHESFASRASALSGPVQLCY
jgi:hypothetical protein